jgi:hypothetical protein
MAPYIFHCSFYDIQSFPLKEPCKKGQVRKVDYLLTHGERVNALTMRGTSALGVAVHYNQYAVAHRLLEWGANPSLGVEDSCPMDLAIENNNLDIVKLLVQFGCAIYEETLLVGEDLEREEILVYLRGMMRLTYNPIPLLTERIPISVASGTVDPFTLEEIEIGDELVRLFGNDHFLYDSSSLETYWNHQLKDRMPLLNPKCPGKPVMAIDQVERVVCIEKN